MENKASEQQQKNELSYNIVFDAMDATSAENKKVMDEFYNDPAMQDSIQALIDYTSMTQPDLIFSIRS